MENYFEDQIVPILKRIVRTYHQPDKTDGDIYEYEVYCDYRDTMSSQTAHEILSSDNPLESFDLKMWEWANINRDYNMIGYDEIRRHLSEEEIKVFESYQDADTSFDLETDIQIWLDEHICFYMPEERFLKQEFDVNLMIATPKEANGDMASYNVLNYYGEYSGEIEEDCALIWLADQMGRKKSVLRAIHSVAKRHGDDIGRTVYKNPFVESVIQELENHSNCMGGITFLVKMSLSELIKLEEMKKQGNGSISISRNADCGIFNPWVGGSSCLEIALPKDVEIPTGMIWDAWIDGTKKHTYDVGDVCGLSSLAWKANTVMLHPVS